MGLNLKDLIAAQSKSVAKPAEIEKPAEHKAEASPATGKLSIATLVAQQKAATPSVPVVVETEDGDAIDLLSMNFDEVQPEVTKGYSDEIPASLPDRLIPEELQGHADGFVALLNGIYAGGFNPEEFGQIIRSIMSELQNHPEYAQILCDEDIHVMMAKMQNSMNMAQIKKAESKAKRAPKEPKPLKVNAMDAFLGNDADFD